MRSFRMILIMMVTAIVAVLYLPIHGETYSAQEKENAIEYMSSIRTGGAEPATVADLDIPIKCGTPITVALRDMKNEIDPALYKALTEWPYRHTYVDTDHFRVHYDTTGVRAPTSPDYVDSVAAVFEYVWNYELSTLEYSTILENGQPVSDGGAGGNSKYDIYLDNLGPSRLYGYTQPDEIPGQRRVASYIVVDNNYTDSIFIALGYGGRPLDALRVTAAHEFFHAIHFSLDSFEASGGRYWWQEATAVWMENKVYTEVNDYLYSLRYFFNYPWLSLETYKTPASGDAIRAMHPYASCVWPMFLDENYNEDVIKDIWNICGQLDGYNVLPATQAVLDDGFSVSFEDAWLEFLTWNYFTGDRADTLNRYSESNLWSDTLAPIVYYDGDWYPDPTREYTFTEGNYVPEQLGSNYLVFDKRFVYEDGGMRTQFTGDPIFDPRDVWRGQILGWDRSRDTVVQVDIITPDNTGEGVFRGWQRYDHIVYIPAIFGYYYEETREGYSLTATFDSLLTDDAPFFYTIPNTVVAKAGDCTSLEIFAHDPNEDSLAFSISGSIDGLSITASSDTSAVVQYCPELDLIDSTITVNLRVEDPDSHYDAKRLDFVVRFFESGSGVNLVGYPNPFNYGIDEFISLRFTLPDSLASSEVQLYVFNIAGDMVFEKEYTDVEWLAPGEMTFRWDGKNNNGKELAGGIYVVKLRAANNSADSKIAIIR